MNRLKYTLAAVILAGLLLAAWLTSNIRAQSRPDSPIIVGDDSIRIQNDQLGNWKPSGPYAMEHPVPDGTLGNVDVTGTGAVSKKCTDFGQCAVEMTWSTGPITIRVIAKKAGPKSGVRLEAKGVRFDDPRWVRTPTKWTLTLPKGATATIHDASTNGQSQPICTAGCNVTVHYQ